MTGQSHKCTFAVRNGLIVCTHKCADSIVLLQFFHCFHFFLNYIVFDSFIVLVQGFSTGAFGPLWGPQAEAFIN